ncbi:MAG TPA: hypothetical protein VHD36_08750 [Pirellulales bacterium]|nr:hypothetical protein [Pirellulales bacterium]
MKKTLLSMMTVALLLAGSASRAAAQGDMKPILVVSLAGYQRIMDDIAFVGKLSDSPDLAKNLEGMITFFTQGQGLAGLDKTKPWGLAASTDGLSFQLLGFVPVTDLKKLLDALSGFLGDPDQEDGVYKIQAGLPIPLYLKEHKGYGYLSQDAASLSSLPDDPTKLLGGLDKQYDVAVRLNVQNIPEVFRQLAIDQFKMGVEGSLEQGPDESDEQFEQRSKMTQQQMDTLVTTLNELDELTLGLSIDEAARRTYLDLQMTAADGTPTAKQMVSLPAPPSKFAGFLMSDAVATLHVNSKASPENTDQSLIMVNSLRQQIMSQIDDQDFGNDQVEATVKDVVGQVMDVLQDTVKKGVVNGGAVIVGDGPFTLAAGGLVSDASRLEAVVKKLADLAKNDGGIPADAVKLNADKHKGVTFHTATFDVPNDDDNADLVKELLGDKLMLTVGIGKESAFLALGNKGIDTLKKVIDKSEGVTETTDKPFELTVSLAPILKLMSKAEDANPIIGAMAATLKESGKDKIQLTVQPIKNGALYRLEAEEGILKILGSAVKLAAAQSGLGAF